MKRCATLLIMRETANQNYTKVSSHNGQNGHHQKLYKGKMLAESLEKRELSSTVCGNGIDR